MWHEVRLHRSIVRCIGRPPVWIRHGRHFRRAHFYQARIWPNDCSRGNCCQWGSVGSDSWRNRRWQSRRSLRQAKSFACDGCNFRYWRTRQRNGAIADCPDRQPSRSRFGHWSRIDKRSGLSIRSCASAGAGLGRIAFSTRCYRWHRRCISDRLRFCRCRRLEMDARSRRRSGTDLRNRHVFSAGNSALAHSWRAS